jgi:deazaflavin-dependent oxidoreductase (nitroreductase family)
MDLGGGAVAGEAVAMDATLIRDASPSTASPRSSDDRPTPSTTFPPLAPGPAPTAASRRMHDFFMKVNRWTMIPAIRAGLGAWIGTPVGGYILLIRVRGRRSGRLIDVPLSYLVAEGAPWVCAGFGTSTQWYRNIRFHPEVEVHLPGRTFAAVAEEIRDPAVRRRIIPALTRAVGLPGALGGVDPYRDSDERILEAYAWVPLVRLMPVGGPIVAGPDDPGGSAWIWRQALVTLLFAVLVRRAIGGIRRMAGRG